MTNGNNGSILQEGKSYIFSDYFELNYPTKDVVAEFGYLFELKKLELPYKAFDGSLEPLKAAFYRRLPHVSLTSETARREVLIAPLILELIDHFEIDVEIEYPLYVNERLRGNIDYFVRSKQHFVVVEAKKADMEKGFTQLAIELIAIEQHTSSDDNVLYGSITVGDMWRFGSLDRQSRTIYKDIDSFRVPSDLEGLFGVMGGILR